MLLADGMTNGWSKCKERNKIVVTTKMEAGWSLGIIYFLLHVVRYWMPSAWHIKDQNAVVQHITS